jgi:hypothetical protein
VPDEVMDAWFHPATTSPAIRRDLARYLTSVPSRAVLLEWARRSAAFADSGDASQASLLVGGRSWPVGCIAARSANGGSAAVDAGWYIGSGHDLPTVARLDNPSRR